MFNIGLKTKNLRHKKGELLNLARGQIANLGIFQLDFPNITDTEQIGGAAGNCWSWIHQGQLRKNHFNCLT